MGRRVKRTQVEAGDGWTVVTHATSGKSGSTGSDEARQLQDARPTRTVEGLTVDKLVADFEKLEARWKETACAKEIGTMLSRKKWSVSEAVCIGSGSFSLDWEHRHRSMWQLVLFMAIVRDLQQHNSQIALFAQEPTFTPLDNAFLSALNVTVLHNSIESHIKNTSFVFAPFVDWYILLPIFLKYKDPELYVGNEILDDYSTFAKSEEKRGVLDECNALGKKFVGCRESVRVPDFEGHAHALNGLMVYWRKEQEESE